MTDVYEPESTEKATDAIYIRDGKGNLIPLEVDDDEDD